MMENTNLQFMNNSLKETLEKEQYENKAHKEIVETLKDQYNMKQGQYVEMVRISELLEEQRYKLIEDTS